MQIHCLKCQRKTNTSGAHLVKGASHRIVGKCTTCGSEKNRFVSKEKGTGFFSNLFSGNVGAALDDVGNGAVGMAPLLVAGAGVKKRKAMKKGKGAIGDWFTSTF